MQNLKQVKAFGLWILLYPTKVILDLKMIDKHGYLKD